mgnify:CR=1 FL=1
MLTVSARFHVRFLDCHRSWTICDVSIETNNVASVGITELAAKFTKEVLPTLKKPVDFWDLYSGPEIEDHYGNQS